METFMSMSNRTIKKNLRLNFSLTHTFNQQAWKFLQSFLFLKADGFTKTKTKIEASKL